jgi:hypothetical protein
MELATGIPCPLCGGKTGQAEVTIDPGEPMVLYYPDGSGHPGSPPSIEDIEEIEWDCDCRNNLSDLLTLPLISGEGKAAINKVLAIYDEKAYDSIDLDMVDFSEPDYDDRY